MGSSDDSLDEELLTVLPPFFAQEAAENFMIPLIAFIETLVAVIEINARSGIQTRIVSKREQDGGSIRHGLRDVLKRCRKAKKATKNSGMLECEMEAIQGTE